MTRDELRKLIFKRKTFLCVGLDTDRQRLPECVSRGSDPILSFNKAVIDATAPWCVAYKINLAFYEAAGIYGITSFKATVDYLRLSYPDHLIIADAKRGDIGNTSRLYARSFFELMDVDAVTVAPYMGEDSVTPFLNYPGRWVILLALTSNSGSRDFQLVADSDGERLFERVIRLSRQWASPEQIMFVVGATQGRMFSDIRRIAPDHFLLVPGVGAQGGSLHEVCRYGMTDDCGLIVNSSRGIIYASDGDDFAEAAGQKARALQRQMAEELEKIKGR